MKGEGAPRERGVKACRCMMLLMDPDMELIEVDLAVTDGVTSARFYDEVFGAGLEAYQAHGATFYRGSLNGVRLVLVPNVIAGVEAQRNRHQFVYSTSDIPGCLARVEAGGGSVRDAGATAATVLDPDGNTIVLLAR